MVHTQSNWTKQFSVYFQFICVRNFVVCSVAFDSKICRPSVIHFVFQLHMYICKCFGVSQKKPKQILKLKQKLNIILCSFDKEDFKICLFLQQQKTKKKPNPFIIANIDDRQSNVLFFISNIQNMLLFLRQLSIMQK